MITLFIAGKHKDQNWMKLSYHGKTGLFSIKSIARSLAFGNTQWAYFQWWHWNLVASHNSSFLGAFPQEISLTEAGPCIFQPFFNIRSFAWFPRSRSYMVIYCTLLYFFFFLSFKPSFELSICHLPSTCFHISLFWWPFSLLFMFLSHSEDHLQFQSYTLGFIATQILYQPPIPSSTGKLSLRQLLIFFHSIDGIQTPASGHLDPAWSWLMPQGPVLVIPHQHIAVPQTQPSCPLAATPLTHVPPRRAPCAAGGGEPNADFS